MGALMGVLGFLGIIVGIVLLIVGIIKKKKFKSGLIIGISFVVLIIGVIVTPTADESETVADDEVEQQDEPIDEEEATEEPVEEEANQEDVENTSDEEEAEDDVPTEYKSALKSAESYSDMLHLSKAGVFDQLTSEYGGQFPEDAAQYAIDNIEADWNENALESARTYQESMDMSLEAIRDQLTSDYGAQFTQEEADYAVENLD